ncbi:hypothetical protein SAMN05216464_114126 [Mucilaginibacter pineti]|uniref:Uncharacterized protein n=1 Tax=Mucilaginibacter pineti TaxID=1391627 RepID=A0A1G7JB58_9SPHI|nr:hypothetical protein [Mucilaginibacter pineti]SDF22192.1 hypothetical protein SAMN05216464_114126 [Mucilaginibacter pineti]
MKQRLFNEYNYGRRVVSLAVLVVFLALGFCPLRNTLTNLAQPAPATRGPKVPEYSKIIAHTDCSFALVVKTGSAIGRLFTVMPPLAAVINHGSYFLNPLRIGKLLSNHMLRLPFHATACPIYLRNCVLLI